MFAGGDSTFESDLLMVRLLSLVLSQGGAQRHRGLLLPALQYTAGVYERASAPGAAAAAVDADLAHVRAAALAGLLSALRYKWQALVGPGAQPVMAPDAERPGGAAGGAAHPLAASLQQHAAAAAAGGAQAAVAGEGLGAAAVTRVLHLLVQFFGAAAAVQSVLAAADVRLVLEELYELQVCGGGVGVDWVGWGGVAGGARRASVDTACPTCAASTSACSPPRQVPPVAASPVSIPHPPAPAPQVATKLYSLPLCQPAWAPLAEALLAMLASRLYTAAQDDLSDSLFALAASNWTEFLVVRWAVYRRRPCFAQQSALRRALRRQPAPTCVRRAPPRGSRRPLQLPARPRLLPQVGSLFRLPAAPAAPPPLPCRPCCRALWTAGCRAWAPASGRRCWACLGTATWMPTHSRASCACW